MEYITDELSTYVHHHVNEGDLLDQFSQDIMTEEKTSTFNKKFATAINNIWQNSMARHGKCFSPTIEQLISKIRNRAYSNHPFPNTGCCF